jgi:hypothetical protein
MATEDPTAEQWLPVVGFPKYEVSSLGRIRSLTLPARGRGKAVYVKRGRVLKQMRGRFGYYRVSLYIDGKISTTLVSRLVCAAFHRPPNEGEECNHLDFDKANNRADNLEWTTPKGNIAHFDAAGRRNPARGERNWNSKLKAVDVRAIRLRLADGFQVKDIAATFGVTIYAIYSIKNRETWTHVS